MEDQFKNLNLNVKIHTPSGILFSGEALSVSSANSVGAFDILPEHANFITIVENQPTIIRDNKQGHTFNFSLAIIHTLNNNVDIYTDIRRLPKLG